MEKIKVMPVMLLVLSVFAIPLASAQNILSMLETEEIQFVLSFLFFFSIVYFALKKIIFGEEQTIAGIVSAIISFFMARTLAAYLSQLMMEYEFAKYVFLVAAIFSIILIAKLLIKIGTIKLKWVAVVTFIVYLIYTINPFSLELLNDFKNSLPPAVTGIVNAVGVLAGLVTVFAIYKLIKTIQSPQERIISAEKKKLEAKEKMDIATAKKSEAEAKKHSAEAQKTALQEHVRQQKEAEFQKRALQRYAKIAERKRQQLEEEKRKGQGKKYKDVIDAETV